MTDRELRKLAVYIVDELNARNADKGNDEDYIFMDEICRLTGLKPQTVYHNRRSMPVERHGGRLCSTRSRIMDWVSRR